MRRRIVQHGSSSLTITLPFRWVEQFGLKKGDELELEVDGPRIVLSTGRDSSVLRKVVDTTDFGVFTKNNVTHLYQLGYDEVEVRFSDELSLRDVKERVAECIGFEVIDQRKNSITVRCIAHTLESEFDVLLRKSFLVTKEMAEGVFAALRSGDNGRLKELRHLEFMNNKFVVACVRILSRRGYHASQRRTSQMYDILKGIERVADEYKYICDLFAGPGRRLSGDILAFFAEVNAYYAAFYSIFYKFDPRLKEKIYLDRKMLKEKGSCLLQKSKGRESVLLHHLLSVIEKVYDSAGEYFALML